MTVTRNPYLLALLGGALFALAYRVPGAWPVSFVALIPLLMASREVKNTREAFLSGTLAGLIIMGTGSSWYFAAYPLPTVFGVSNPIAGLIFIIFSWTLVTLSTSICVGFWMMFARLLNLSYVLDSLVVALIWPAFEYMRMFTFNALTFASGYHNPLFYTAGFSGIPLLDSESWRQLVAFGGVPFLGFLIAISNVLIYAALRAKRREVQTLQLVGIWTVILFITCVPIVSLRQSLDTNRSKEVPVSVALLSSWAPDTGGRTRQDDALTVTNSTFARDAIAQHADIVLLPEDSHLLEPFSQETLGEFAGAPTQSVIVDSGLIQTGDHSRFVRAYGDMNEGNKAVRDKLVLTPQGEYLPFLFRLFLHTVGARQEEQRFTENRNYINGVGSGTVITAGPARLSVLFCLEVMMPQLARTIAREQHANLLLVPASHGWFQPSPSLELDIMRYSQLQAVESGLPLATSVIHGPAFAIDKYGRLIDEVSDTGTTQGKIISIPVVPVN